METTFTAEGSELTAFVTGNLDTSTADDFYNSVAAALDGAPDDSPTGAIQDLVIDLKDVEFVSSKGLRALVKLYKQMGDGHFKVVNTNEAVTRVITLSSLSKRFGLEN